MFLSKGTFLFSPPVLTSHFCPSQGILFKFFSLTIPPSPNGYEFFLQGTSSSRPVPPLSGFPPPFPPPCKILSYCSLVRARLCPFLTFGLLFKSEHVPIQIGPCERVPWPRRFCTAKFPPLFFSLGPVRNPLDSPPGVLLTNCLSRLVFSCVSFPFLHATAAVAVYRETRLFPFETASSRHLYPCLSMFCLLTTNSTLLLRGRDHQVPSQCPVAQGEQDFPPCFFGTFF